MQPLKHILFLQCFLLLAAFHSLSSPSAPSLRSTVVNAAGTVKLYWIPPSDTGTNFHSYLLYRSSAAAGPFTKIDSIFNYAQNSYTDLSVNANIVKFYYFIITRSDCCVLLSPPSDTLSSMKLNVTNTGNGIAFLSWNAIHAPKLSTSSPWYLIYNQYVPLPYSLIDSTQNLNFLDTTTACNSQVNYRVELRDASGWVSVSSIDGNIFHDLIPTSLTVIDTVSVNPYTGIASISWKKNLTKDTRGYIIYKFNGVSWDSISTVYGYNNTGYTNLLSNAGNVSEKYAISTIDSCNNSTGFSINHSTIFLKTSLNKCESKIRLDWNAYLNLSGGVNSYKIFVSKNSGLFQYTGSVSGEENSYDYLPPEADSTYCFFVQAIGNISSKTSSSNKSCLAADIFKEPLFTYIRTATVVSSTEVNVLCYMDSTAEIVSFNLLRSLNSAGPFDSITTVPFNGVSGFVVSDPSVKTADQSYYYQVETLDSCGNSVSKSNVAKTILAKSAAENNFINLITWDDYEGWGNGTGYFNIYRRLTPESPSVYLASVAGNVHEYRDDVIAFYDTPGQFCYSVEAVERILNSYGFRDSSFSNESCNWQIPVTFIPNAFSPYGHNSVFYPVNVFVDLANYSFVVFSRWGEKIFETNDPKQGWTGDYKGNYVPAGVYVYLLRYLDNNGKEVKRRGTVTLIK
ncbi:MAG TPA: gliding motility-associated C-terminal domain-containing protein [Bacteroidia bacterium]|nr:gliding motility-associated C-terminal domain-containing protein [Bacteroidia bacterium]